MRARVLSAKARELNRGECGVHRNHCNNPIPEVSISNNAVRVEYEGKRRADIWELTFT